MSNLELLKALVEKTTDKAELDKLNGQILDEVRAEEKAKLEKEFADKAADVERKAAVAKSEEAKIKASGIEVGTPGIYKGRKLKMEMEAIGSRRKEWKDHPEKAELVAKTWLDALDRASNAPGVMTKTNYISEANTGAYLTAPEYSREYLAYASEYSRALQICRNVPMTGQITYIPTELARCTVALTAEDTAATVTSATFAQTTLTAKRFDAYTTISNEVLTDLNTPVLPILMDQLTEAVGQKVDSAVFDASGSPMSSVFSAAAGYSVVLGTGSSTFANVVFSSFFDVVAKIPSARQRNARWVAHRTPLWTYIYQIKDAASRPVFLNNIDKAGIDAPAGTILGYPVTQLETGPSATAVSTAITVFGDFSGVVIGHRLDSVDLFMDPYTEGKSYRTNFYMFTRWGFALALPNQFCRLVTAAA